MLTRVLNPSMLIIAVQLSVLKQDMVQVIQKAGSTTGLPFIRAIDTDKAVGATTVALRHAVHLTELAPIPFLKGLVSLALQVAESIEAKRQRKRTAESLKVHATSLLGLVEQYAEVENLAPGVKTALHQLSESLKNVHIRLSRMLEKRPRYFFQSSDAEIIKDCTDEIQRACSIFNMACNLYLIQQR